MGERADRTPPDGPADRKCLHAPEVECIGKGKGRVPYEFGSNVSVATPARLSVPDQIRLSIIVD
jgi:transposase, IS5 family